MLDTNVVLDWLLFDDPSIAALARAVSTQRVCWIASLPMRAELARVLEGGRAAVRGHDAAALLRLWDLHAATHPPGASHPLRCRDPDDQMFVDLALAAGARWLVSRDRAVLALRRRAAPLGLQIVRPTDWRPE